LKNILKSAALPWLFLSLAVCQTQESQSMPSTGSPVESRYAYDQDWEIIKEAILEKDLSTFAQYAESSDLDPDFVIRAFHADPEYMEQLRNSSYKDLKVEQRDGEILLVFSVYVSDSDEDGNVYESGLYLYMRQGEPSLEIISFLAAG
jgi:hypothetical protein